jgi:hypothetical protein
MRSKNIDYQLAPPHCHRRNSAEHAIRKCKNHFIAGLASTNKQSPLHLWDRLIPQAVTTLNLLRQSRLNPRLSAHAQLNGTFDYNRTPMAPPGTRVILHKTPAQRGTWATHGERGWYIGPAPEHYRNYRLYVTKTAAERICGTVEFFQVSAPCHAYPPPTPSSNWRSTSSTHSEILLQQPRLPNWAKNDSLHSTNWPQYFAQPRPRHLQGWPKPRSKPHRHLQGWRVAPLRTTLPPHATKLASNNASNSATIHKSSPTSHRCYSRPRAPAPRPSP